MVEKKVALDDKDLAILRLLQSDAKMTVRDIAQKVHLSPTPVHERIKRLEEQGVILQYAALLDRNRLDKQLMVICYVSLKEHNKRSGEKFIDFVMQMDEVVECFNISGEFDFMLKVLAKDMNDYYDFHVNKLGQVDNLGHLQSIFVMGVIKESHRLIGQGS